MIRLNRLGRHRIQEPRRPLRRAARARFLLLMQRLCSRDHALDERCEYTGGVMWQRYRRFAMGALRAGMLGDPLTKAEETALGQQASQFSIAEVVGREKDGTVLIAGVVRELLARFHGAP
jgi:hypothetical protein